MAGHELPRNDASETTRIELEPSPSAPYKARRFVRYESAGVDPGLLDDLLLLVSELVSTHVINAPHEASSVALVLRGAERVIVTIRGRGLAPSSLSSRSQDALLPSDLNVMLLDTIAETWGQVAGGDGIWFELRVPGRAPVPV